MIDTRGYDLYFNKQVCKNNDAAFQCNFLFNIFVRDGIYNSVADYNSTWRVLCVSCVLGKTLLRGNFEMLPARGLIFLCGALLRLATLGAGFSFQIDHPNCPTPHVTNPIY